MRSVLVVSVVAVAVPSVAFMFRSGSAAREISTDVLVAGSDLVLRLTNAEADGWKHCLGPSVEIRSSCLRTFLQRDIEDAPVYGIVVRFCAVWRVWALDLSRLSAAGAWTDVHRSFQRVWPCVHKNVISRLVHRSLVLCLESSPWSRENFACVMLH
jgi:hypothetical protein